MKQKTKVTFLFFLILLSFHPSIQRNKINYTIHNKKNIDNIEPFLSDRYVGSYFVPGVSEAVSSNQILKIGILGDLDHPFTDHIWMGAKLAAKEINEDGGLLISGTQFYIGLVAEDNNEWNVPRNITEGINAAEKMINDYKPHFIIGGFVTENIPALDVITENKIPLISTGTADPVGDIVSSNYERYKYVFRITPLNSTYLVGDFIKTIIYLANYLNMTYGGIVSKIAIIRQDVPWTKSMSDVFKLSLPFYGLTVIKDIPFPENATSTDFNTYWDTINSSGAQLTFPIATSLDAITMLKTYRVSQPRCLLAGMNILSQLDTFWDDTEGACQYEITMQSIYRTAKTPLTIAFWDNFIAEYNIEPIFTGAGSYDAVYLLAHAVEDVQTFDADTIVMTLEKINASNPLTTAGGNLAFTKNHDVRGGWPYAHGLLTQWKYIDGTKVVIPSDLYPDSLATGSLRLPYWGINGLLTDPPDPPGEFTLDSDAGNPEKDGKFNLNWTDSEGADNYSVYMTDKNITYISKKFDLLAYQISASSFSISGLKEGNYYFAAVAYNKTGETMSSNIVRIRIPSKFPYEIVIVVVIVIIVGAISAGIIIVKKKPLRKKVISKKAKQVIIEKKHKKTKSFDSSTAVLKSQELGGMQEIEEELGIEKEKHSCIVHGGEIVGAIYICPTCETYYCMECASDLKRKGKTCQVCKNEINL